MSAADAGRDRAREELFDLFDRVVTIAKQLEAAKNKVPNWKPNLPRGCNCSPKRVALRLLPPTHERRRTER